MSEEDIVTNRILQVDEAVKTPKKAKKLRDLLQAKQKLEATCGSSSAIWNAAFARATGGRVRDNLQRLEKSIKSVTKLNKKKAERAEDRENARVQKVRKSAKREDHPKTRGKAPFKKSSKPGKRERERNGARDSKRAPRQRS